MTMILDGKQQQQKTFWQWYVNYFKNIDTGNRDSLLIKMLRADSKSSTLPYFQASRVSYFHQWRWLTPVWRPGA